MTNIKHKFLLLMKSKNTRGSIQAINCLAKSLCNIFVLTIIWVLLATSIKAQVQCDKPISLQQPIIYVDICAKGSESGAKYSPFQTLGCALKAAQDGHIIQLKTGVYQEKLIIKKQLTLRASDGAVRIGGNYDCGKTDVKVKLKEGIDASARIYYPKDPVYRGESFPKPDNLRKGISCGGPFPVVVYAHGLRSTSQTMPCEWLSTKIKQSIQETTTEDYKRLEGILKRLAMAGIIAISVDWHANRDVEISSIVSKTITYMEIENENPLSWLGEKVDMKRVGLLGHSTGGAAVSKVAIRLSSMIKAVGLLAPSCPNALEWRDNHEAPCFEGWNPPANIPIIVIHGTREHQCQVGEFPEDLYCSAKNPKHLVVINGANHFGYTDNICLDSNFDRGYSCDRVSPLETDYFPDDAGFDNSCAVGGLTGKAAHNLQQLAAGNYLRAFFMHYLKIPTGKEYIDYLVQPNGKCNNDGNPLCQTPKKMFSDLEKFNVEVNICSEQ